MIGNGRFFLIDGYLVEQIKVFNIHVTYSTCAAAGIGHSDVNIVVLIKGGGGVLVDSKVI